MAKDVSFKQYPRGGGCIVGYGRHSQRITSRMSRRISGESPNLRYFMARRNGEVGSETATQRPVSSIICHYIDISRSHQHKITRRNVSY